MMKERMYTSPRFDERSEFWDIHPDVVEQHRLIDTQLANSDSSGHRHINPGVTT